MNPTGRSLPHPWRTWSVWEPTSGAAIRTAGSATCGRERATERKPPVRSALLPAVSASRTVFTSTGISPATGKSKFTYRPFTLEGNFAFAAGLQEMLLQSQGGILRLFPAIPSSWKEASFRDFRAEGAFLVTAALREGSLDSVRIFPEKDGRLRILNPFSQRPFGISGTDLPEEARNDRILTMNAHAGREIILRRMHR